VTLISDLFVVSLLLFPFM